MSFAVTAKLICVFVFAYMQNFLFSHDAAQMISRSAKNVGGQSLYGIHIWDLLGITVIHTFYDRAQRVLM